MADQVAMEDFSGGVKDGRPSPDFTENQWTRLYGVFLEADGRRLRAQWGMEQLASGWASVAAADGFLTGVDSVGELVAYDLVAGTEHVLGDAEGQTPTATIPWLAKGMWRSAILFTALDGGAAKVVYRDDEAGSGFAVESRADRYPTGSPSPDTIPYANVASTWGDFTILGDVMWVEDDSEQLSAENSIRRGNGLWFSYPGSSDQYDPIDVQFVGNADSENYVVAVHALDVGLLVITTTGVHLFRGTANQHEPEELRLGVGAEHPADVDYWPAAGAMVWTDGDGKVWHTNGDRVGRLDLPLPPAAAGGPMACAGDLMFAVRDDRWWAFRMGQEDGAWTEVALGGLGVPVDCAVYGGEVFFVDDQGVLVRMAADLPRGEVLGQPVVQELVTPTLSTGDGHLRTFWHRFGWRASGPGAITGAECRPGPWFASQPGGLSFVETDLDGDRQLRVWPTHGPSLEAAFAVFGEGDVTWEGGTVWFHKGSAHRE